jgi:D-threonate/D-erythronate kinase
MRVFVLADDLTGANATASLLKRQGLPSHTHLLHSGTAAMPASLHEDGVHVLDLDTRDRDDSEAASRVAAAAALIGKMGDLTGLRTDSTLRGPIPASLDALLSDPTRLSLVVPAFPASGRTTRDGIHYVYGTPLAQTEVAHDPVCPVTTSSVTEWIGSRLHARTAMLNLGTVRKGASAIAVRLGQILADGVSAVFCDAETDRDIDEIAHAAVALWRRWTGLSLLPVDPGPFTAAVLRVMREPTELSPWVFGIIGSTMDTSRQQMDFVEAGGYAFTVPYMGQPPHELLAAFEQAPPGAKALLLRTDTVRLDADQRLHLYEGLSALFEGMLARFPSIGGYLLSGGETAGRLLAAFGVSSLRIQSEIQPLISMSRIVDGRLSGDLLVTKGGTVGSESAIADALGRLYDALVDDGVTDWSGRKEGEIS